ncbi:MAG: hypothetical protein WB791_02160 [Waddliaceae bacterium]
MRISIAQRLHPFSHLPGTRCVLPGSTIGLEIFPTLIRAHDLSDARGTKMQEMQLALSGPVDDFTVQQDLEKGRVMVWGHFEEGFVRYVLSSVNRNNAFAIYMEKCPARGIQFSNVDRPISVKDTLVVEKEAASFEEVPLYMPPKTDRLSLGSHRKHDWELVQRRADLCDILPVWHRLGQLVLQAPSIREEGMGALIHQCELKIASHDKPALAQAFLNAFQGAFEGIFCPRWIDTRHQGFIVAPLSRHFNDSPLALLSVGARLIRRLFIDITEDALGILPVLPPEFHCGRFLHIVCPNIGDVDFEWSKKRIRRLVLHSKSDRQLHLFFQKEIKTFRLRSSVADRGKSMPVGMPIKIESGTHYFFDNFKR